MDRLRLDQTKLRLVAGGFVCLRAMPNVQNNYRVSEATAPNRQSIGLQAEPDNGFVQIAVASDMRAKWITFGVPVEIEVIFVFGPEPRQCQDNATNNGQCGRYSSTRTHTPNQSRRNPIICLQDFFHFPSLSLICSSGQSGRAAQHRKTVDPISIV